DDVTLELRGVVAHVVDDREPELAWIPTEDAPEHLAHAMRDDLAVGERRVRRGVHGREVGLALRRAERGAGELAIADADAVARHQLIEPAQIVAPDLMTEAAGATVQHDQDLARRLDAERARHSRIVDASGRDDPDLHGGG